MDSGGTDLDAFPSDILKGFDPADKKLIAVALAHGSSPPIPQAANTRWWAQREKLRQAGVNVEFLCPKNVSRVSEKTA